LALGENPVDDGFDVYLIQSSFGSPPDAECLNFS
jgi:hypothetical protein